MPPSRTSNQPKLKVSKKQKVTKEGEEAASDTSNSDTNEDSKSTTELKHKVATSAATKHLTLDRQSAAKSVLDFNFKKKRIHVLSKTETIPEWCRGIVYWMSREARVQDNWAFLYAQKLALKNRVPLHVCYCFVPRFLDSTLRHYTFLLGGLQEVATECRSLNIPFHLFEGEASTALPKLIKVQQIGGVVCDFWPLRLPRKWLQDLLDKLPEEVAVCQVDAQNVIPIWETSDHQEYAARTIRIKINKLVEEYLQPFPPLIRHPHDSNKDLTQSIDWNGLLERADVDTTVLEVDWAQPGYVAGIRELNSFCEKRLALFDSKRNDPTIDACSNLSPWLRFGHISAQRCILTVRKFRSKHSESCKAFEEEILVRRELSENFCYYNENYDSLDGASDWAKNTLKVHSTDKRPWLYTRLELEQSRTHDDLWNAAQIQLVRDGKMHGFLRMYWAKKILEWTENPKEALSTALYLNDKYNLDGTCPNGYVGCMWSIAGVHDMGWKERPVFGKIRYMVYSGCQRKFDVKAFVARYGGKVYNKKE